MLNRNTHSSIAQVDPDFAVNWMTDFEKFQEALDQGTSSFANDLTRSLSLVLDTFYQKLNWVAISSKTGEGFDKVSKYQIFSFHMN